MQNSPDPFLRRVLSHAFSRLERMLAARLPLSRPALQTLLEGVPRKPRHAFGPRAFPHMLLPFWLSPASKRSEDFVFQSDLMYSSIMGYYSIRLCDNIADGDGPPDLRRLAPLTLPFDAEAIRVFTRYFPDGHAFWPLFDRFAAAQADASAADSLMREINAEDFAAVAAKKFSGSKITIAAALLRYDAPEPTLDRWFRIVDVLGDFAQFSNDFFDWRRDLQNGVVTYLSCEARRRAPASDLTSWMLDEGFDWGVAELYSRFDKVKQQIASSDNAEAQSWTLARGRVLEEDVEALRAGLELMRTLGKIVSGRFL